MTIKKILDELKSTSSTNEKINILKNNMDNEIFKQILFYTYNSFIVYYINKIPKVEIGSNNSIDKNFKIVEDMLLKLSSREITGNNAIDFVKNVLESFDKDSQDILIKILKRDLRVNISETSINKVWKDFIPTFKVQLANKFAELKENKISEMYYVSAKMDGIRGFYIVNKGLFSRNGKKIIGFEDTIEKECEEICNEFKIGGIDGELFSRTIPFEKIQGFVLSNKNINVEEKKQILFNVFAVVKDFYKKEIFKTTLIMLNCINDIFLLDRKYLIKMPQLLMFKSDIDSAHDEFVKMGFEGIMLRDVNVSYSFKRDNYLLKLKKFKEDDFTIDSVFEGAGKYENQLGGFIVSGKVDNKSILSEVGSGLSDEQRKEYWKTQKELIGKKIEVKYQGITPDGSLRFPIFMKIKLDRD